MDNGNVIPFPVTEVTTPEQRQYWHEQAAYWAIKEEDAEVALAYARRQRAFALGRLGMLGAEAQND